MKFIELPLPVDDRTPEGFRLVVAYAKGSKVFLPIAEMPENEDHHDCDWEGCSSIDHVASVDFEQKYVTEKENSQAVKTLNQIKNILHDDKIFKERKEDISDFILNKIYELLPVDKIVK